VLQICRSAAERASIGSAFVVTYYKIEAQINGRWKLLKAAPHQGDLTDDELIDFAREEAKSLNVARSVIKNWRVARMSDSTFFDRTFESEFAID
jgi:hypothetical protein